jgi:hypothetical protein
VIWREGFEQEIEAAFVVHSVVALLGPRQAGKTTLARMFASRFPEFPAETNYFDLENPLHEARLANPHLALELLRGLVVIDEVQRVPDLFPVLRVLVDREQRPARFLILGSASRDLIRQSSESLAGRVEYLELTPFGAGEIGASADAVARLWLRGGFPPAFLADEDAHSFRWLAAFVRNYLERDVPGLGISLPPASLRRFWMMLTHVHGQILNSSEIGRSFGVADTTVKRYLDVLTGTFMLRLLPPWHENISKRQVKRPKVLFRDSGILHSLLGVSSWAELQTHPKLGASWEGFALEQIVRWHGARHDEAYFWAVHSQAELDLLIVKGGQRFAYEIKYSDSPRATRSVRAAREQLRLDRVTIVHPGRGRGALDEGIDAVGLDSLIAAPAPPA